jgi:sulfatase maturation enzyme AslB (radical SAM superfamily)
MGELNKDTFCYLPFGSIYVEPTGRLHPCCIASPFEENINWKDFNSVEELINSPAYKRIRKQLINGEKPSECSACFIHGNIHRESSNGEFKNYVEEESLYNEDYSVNKVTYVDLRLSNMCNFACRMCFHGLSSTWHEYWGYIQGKPEYKDEHPKFLIADENGIGKFSPENISTITKVYLAGGEPFIAPHTFELLDRFTDEQASRVTILINTNLSTLTYKGTNILDKLIRFKKVQIACSCDGYGEIGEYQRPGFNSNRFFKNLKTLVEYSKDYNHITVEIDYTISTINVYHTFDFIEYIGDNFLDRNKIRVHAVVQPVYLSTGFFKDNIKRELIYLYRKKSLEYKNKNFTHLSASLEIFIKYLEDSFSVQAKEERERILGHMQISIPETFKRFDEVHNTSYVDTCPWILDNITF